MRISDWSSDGCSSDLPGGYSRFLDSRTQPGAQIDRELMAGRKRERGRGMQAGGMTWRLQPDDHPDRKGDEKGKRVSVRVELGGRGNNKEKKHKYRYAQRR